MLNKKFNSFQQKTILNWNDSYLIITLLTFIVELLFFLWIIILCTILFEEIAIIKIIWIIFVLYLITFWIKISKLKDQNRIKNALDSYFKQLERIYNLSELWLINEEERKRRIFELRNKYDRYLTEDFI